MSSFPMASGRHDILRLLPHSLRWRTFLLVAALMLLSMLAWFAIYSTYDEEPRARQMSELLVSVVNLTRSALINAQPDRRHTLLRDFSDREGIRIYPATADEKVDELPDRPLLQRVATHLRDELGPQTRLTLGRNGEHAVFVSFRIDETDDSEYWVALPRERIERATRWRWLGWSLAALLLSLGGAGLIVFRATRPLQALARAAQEIGRGRTPAPLPESGPGEIATLARAFNQMSSDLAHLDSDRTLILAGISHDLRTPLARLRMGIEMIAPGDHGDTATREGMIADVEEMDRTIGQFLDFARETGGEPMQETDPAGLLADLAAQYARRGAIVETDLPSLATPPLPLLRPQALRRAVANLIDNARHHGGEATPIHLAAHADKDEIRIEVSDRGPGIPPQEIERLKQPFTRLETARSNVGGAGLGLAIVDRIARAHGGTLDLLPRDGGGLTACIRLPRRPNRTT